jgi:translation elongation factor aEF-1 beta
MSTAAIRYKIMPENLKVNLDELRKKIKEVIESFESGVFNEATKEPIAFGLNALIVTLALSEDQIAENVENKIAELEGVSSVELIDFRRAVG